MFSLAIEVAPKNTSQKYDIFSSLDLLTSQLSIKQSHCIPIPPKTFYFFTNFTHQYVYKRNGKNLQIKK